MGVTLERVQNKFACIIGELCGEPKILSQFAIWIDLRLAEYKSKGFISLECSGNVPEPSWLEGLSITPNSTPLDHLTPYHTSGGTYPQALIPDSRRPNSIDSVLNMPIKCEPNAELTDKSPVARTSNNHARKRSSDGASLSLHNYDGPSSAKHLKFMSSSAGNIYQNTSNKTPPQTTDSALDTHTESADGDMACLIMNNVTNDLRRRSSQSEDGSLFPMHHGTGLRQSDPKDFLISATTSDSSPSSYQSPSVGSSLTGVRGGAKCRTTSDLHTFQNWLRTNSEITPRPIEEFPPEELDPILADFFRTVKNRRGKDYDHKSLKYIRASLERHLKANCYPFSITRSREFYNSQLAYRLRKKQLEIENSLALKREESKPLDLETLETISSASPSAGHLYLNSNDYPNG